MSSNLNALAKVSRKDFDDAVQPTEIERVIEFYEEASLDYGHWSRDFNMHLGFYRRGLNPFDREQMLEQKLEYLQGVIRDTQQASNEGWQAIIDEDRLLARINALEDQIRIYHTKV